MSELGPLVQEALGRAIVAVVPLLLAALGGGAIAGWLAGRLGLQDPVTAGVLRGLAVLAALVLVAEGLADGACTLAADAWSELPAVGRAER